MTAEQAAAEREADGYTYDRWLTVVLDRSGHPVGAVPVFSFGRRSVRTYQDGGDGERLLTFRDNIDVLRPTIRDLLIHGSRGWAAAEEML